MHTRAHTHTHAAYIRVHLHTHARTHAHRHTRTHARTLVVSFIVSFKKEAIDQQIAIDAPGYYLKDVNLDNVDFHKDLDVIVDNHYLFKQHVSYICKKAYCSTNVLFRCFHTANTAALIRGYKSCIRPVLEYCSTVWNPYIHARHYIGMTDQLENVQRYFTRRVYYRCKLEYKHDYPERLLHLKLESL